MKIFSISNMAQNSGFLTFAGLCFFIKGCMHLYRNSFGIGNPITFSFQVFFALLCFYYAARFYYSFQRGDRSIQLDGNSFYFPGSQVSHFFKFHHGVYFTRDEIKSVSIHKRWPMPSVYFVRITTEGGMKLRLTNFTVSPSDYELLLFELQK